MTTTYDPHHPVYLDETDLRAEFGRVFDLCHGCRLCFNLCPSFPSLFGAVDAHDGQVALLTAGEQDRVVDECYQCKLCYLECPYVPPHDWQLDFPRLMTRAHAVRAARPGRPIPTQLSDQFLGRTDLLGRLATTAAPLVNAVTGRLGSFPRKAMQKAVGIHAERVLPPYAKQRFTTWFKGRRMRALEAPRAEVALFPTCFVEYMEPAIGRDLVAVLERNDVACTLAEPARCCGAPWLHGGDVARFTEAARRNVAVLAGEVRAGRDVVVAQPTCAYVIRRDYPIYAPGADADLVAAHAFDASEYLMLQHRRDGGGLDTSFEGAVPETVVYHLACHLRAQNVGFKGRDLIRLTGATVQLVARCSGIDGTWGYRAENYELARKVARPLIRELDSSTAEVVCGDCHLANTAIAQETGRRPMHPVQLLARAYGISEGQGRREESGKSLERGRSEESGRSERTGRTGGR
ncbi:MAG TPA: heterodisulfide reductase-related iron-sulfur binding cluster [Acidimicrobiales bacterium]|nr:heterodisulfide reductase-related iron-sulfur binding cluster [Acidimicrobiales bacterium]